MPDWKFIAAVPQGLEGESGEQSIWDAVRQAFTSGEGVAIWGYRTFSVEKQVRWEPDILIASRKLGLIIIEVKSCQLQDIEQIEAICWHMAPTFYCRDLYPFTQAEKQLRVLLKHCDRQPLIQGKIPARVIVALPRISRQEWRNRGFNEKHHTCPPILFRDDLGPRTLIARIEHDAIIINRGNNPLVMNEDQWQILLSVICGPKPKLDSNNSSSLVDDKAQKSGEAFSEIKAFPPRSKVLQRLRNCLSEIDWQQVRIGRQIPPGPQRIRGIAGSGKTLLLCQKAVHMHLKYPEWDIVLLFFNRSLYSPIIELIEQWMQFLSDGEQHYTDNSRLKILHAWGAKDQPGFYSILRNQYQISSILSAPIEGLPPEKLAILCRRLLEQVEIQPCFDAILVDEGQDMATNDSLKWDDKQAFYWLAWQTLRPGNPLKPLERRLIWAYDQAQSLSSLKTPTAKELLGEEMAQIVTGSYPGGISKSEVMPRCYRTPGPILVAAHGIGMGLLRAEGMIAGITTQRGWREIGYEVEGDFRRIGSTIILHRPVENSPNPLPSLWGGSLINLDLNHPNRESELLALVNNIRWNLEYDQLQLSRDLLVIVLENIAEKQRLFQKVASTFLEHKINFYIPGAAGQNRYPESNAVQANQFWQAGAVTISRIYQAKGHEAPLVYIVGLDHVAKCESNVLARNQLFIALTRSQAWVNISGIQDTEAQDDYPMYQELRQVIGSGNSFKFIYKKPPIQSLEDP